MSDMRIAHVMMWYLPGMGYQENHLPSEQMALGHEVCIIATDILPDYVRTVDSLSRRVCCCDSARYPSDTTYPVVLKLRTIPKIRFGDFGIPRKLGKALRKFDPDVVHAHGAFSPLTLEAALLKEKIGFKLFIDDHSHEGNFHPEGAVELAYVKFVAAFHRLLGKRVDCWLPVTDSAHFVLRSVIGVDEKKMEMLDLGADTRRFYKNPESRGEMRTNLRLPEDQLLILSSGKFDRSKDIHVLLGALSQINRGGQRAKLLLLGSAEEQYLRDLQLQVKYHKIEEYVIFRDFATSSELPKYFNAADIGVWPGNHSISVIEAMATGLPAVVPSGIRAYAPLLEADSAMGFERGDVASLANAISRLTTDSSLRVRMSCNGQILARQRFSWETIARKSIEVYDNR